MASMLRVSQISGLAVERGSESRAASASRSARPLLPCRATARSEASAARAAVQLSLPALAALVGVPAATAAQGDFVFDGYAGLWLGGAPARRARRCARRPPALQIQSLSIPLMAQTALSLALRRRGQHFLLDRPRPLRHVRPRALVHHQALHQGRTEEARLRGARPQPAGRADDGCVGQAHRYLLHQVQLLNRRDGGGHRVRGHLSGVQGAREEQSEARRAPRGKDLTVCIGGSASLTRRARPSR